MSLTQVTSSQLATYRAASTPALKRAVAARLREAAQILADAARGISGGFSKRIPASVRIMGGTTEVFIVAGGESAPNGAPFENGSWHPVFASGDRGKWHWAKQPHKPFLEEAIASAGDAAAEAFSAIIDDWCKELDL